MENVKKFLADDMFRTIQDEPKYVLVTPAKDEEAHIEKTIKSVVNQIILPVRWVIVNDGSTDATEEIVKFYEDKYEFLKLVNKDNNQYRNFASKVEAFKLGYSYLKNVTYNFIGNLDADIHIEPYYFEYIISEFQNNGNLGIAGGIIYDLYNGSFKKQGSSLNSVAGAVQLFRRECYEEIGGYIPIEGGLIDAVAEVTARMHGWHTRSFPELKVLHFRKTGSAGYNLFRSAIRQGKLEYMFGYHPLFQLARSIQRVRQDPIILGSLLRSFSFLVCLLKRKKRPVSDDFVSFLRKEELEKIKFLFSLHV